MRAVRSQTPAGVVAVLALLFGLCLGVVAAGPTAAAAPPQKKVCRVVLKRVHGKRKRVRICHKVKRPSRHPQPPPPPLPPPPPPPPLTGTGGLHSSAAVTILGTPVGGAVGFGAVWVRTGTQLFRLDPGSGSVAATIDGLPSSPNYFGEAVAAGEGAVWTSNIAGGTVTRIDPATNEVVATISVWPTNAGCYGDPTTECPAPATIVTTPGAVWVILHHEWKVVRIDPATNTVVATVSIGSGPPGEGPEGLAAANGMVYATGNDSATGKYFLKRIDPAANAVTPVVEIPSAFNCDAKAAAGTHVWLESGGCDSGAVADVDTATASIAAHVDVAGPVFALAVSPGSVWVATGNNELLRINPATHAVTGRLSFPAGPAAAMWTGDGAVWLGLQNVVYRIEG
jgi:virginiamycin B lyase